MGWQERLHNERTELIERIGRLKAFRGSQPFIDLAPADRELLVDQLAIMEALLRIISARVARLE